LVAVCSTGCTAVRRPSSAVCLSAMSCEAPVSSGPGCPQLVTRAEVREEVHAALASFTQDVLRRELERSASAMREEWLPPGAVDSARTSPVAEEFRWALEEWSPRSLGADGPVPPPGAGFDQQKAVPRLHRFQSTTPTASPGSTASGPPSSPSVSPFSLPAALSTAESLEVPTPLSSPVWTPANPPDIIGSVVSSPASFSGKDWRRSFVEKATKANRKVEYLHGFQCRATLEVNDVLEEANKALEDGVKPHLVEDGLGGTYFVKDRSGRSIAVFKPRDEEPLAPNNPKVHAGEGQGAGLKEGVLVGEAAINEYVAYLLDQVSSPFLRAGVCPTALVCVANSVFHSATEDRHSVFRTIKDKVGSFQLFAQHDCTSEDLGPSRFPADQVHRIAALDIRLCNTDRHSGNILVREQRGEVSALLPIDHGYALPGKIGAEVTFEWVSWPASKVPFSEEMRREILAIDPDSVEAALRKRVPLLRPGCLRTLRTCTRLLQIGVEAGLTAHDIGALMIRPDEDPDSGEEPQMSALQMAAAETGRRAAEAPDSSDESWQRLLDEVLREKCQAVAQGLQA